MENWYDVALGSTVYKVEFDKKVIPPNGYLLVATRKEANTTYYHINDDYKESIYTDNKKITMYVEKDEIGQILLKAVIVNT